MSYTTVNIRHTPKPAAAPSIPQDLFCHLGALAPLRGIEDPFNDDDDFYFMNIQKNFSFVTFFSLGKKVSRKVCDTFFPILCVCKNRLLRDFFLFRQLSHAFLGTWGKTFSKGSARFASVFGIKFCKVLPGCGYCFWPVDGTCWWHSG